MPLADTTPKNTIHNLSKIADTVTLNKLLGRLGADFQYYGMQADPTGDGYYAKYARTVFEGVDVVVVREDLCGGGIQGEVDIARMHVPGRVDGLEILRLGWAATIMSFVATYKVDPLWGDTPPATVAAAEATLADLKAISTPNEHAYGSCDKVMEGIALTYDPATRTLTIEPGIEG